MTYVLAALLGVGAGVLSGLFGVGGGILFVPTLTALGLSQLHAEASSLLAIIPTVMVGVWRQQRYGNVRWRGAAYVGVASVGATVGGAQVAESLPESTLRKLFAVLMILTAAQIAWRAYRKGHNPPMPETDELWIPLVDEPIGSIVAEIQRENPDIARLVESPHRILAFRTFAYIRCGLVLGQLLFDHDVPAYDGSESWIETLLREPTHHAALTREVRAVAEEIAADPKYADEGPVGPDEDARQRFRAFAREHLSGSP
ncbi:MAG: uncharacterized protein V7644_2133 [Actinomycetota bacterium]